MRRFTAAALLVLILGGAAGAQPKTDPGDVPALRYELGARLKRFEAAWEKQPDPATRKRSLSNIQKLTQQFFSFQFGEAGRSLDLATYALATDAGPGPSRQWAWSLYVVPEKRLVDASAKEITVTIRQFYPVEGEKPKSLEVQLWFTDKQITKLTPEKFPVTVKVPLPPAGEFKELDRRLYFMVESGKEIRVSSVGISQVADLDARLAGLKKAVDAWDSLDSIEKATARDRLTLLTDLAAGTVPETDLPAGNLLANAEAMIAGKPFYTADKGGQFWLSVPLDGKKTAPVRVFVPRGLDEKKAVPVVVALHGAGGSENLFFEGYGNGHIVTECRKRGWLLVATRSELAFLGGAPPVPAILDQLAKRYPLDLKRVFLVGHSMGAAQTVELVQKHPGKFAGAAALGGGGTVRDAKPFADLPFFVGVGDKDFALNMARGLNKALAPGGKKLVFREYPGLEHLLIVREALPDVFEVFDATGK